MEITSATEKPLHMKAAGHKGRCKGCIEILKKKKLKLAIVFWILREKSTAGRRRRMAERGGGKATMKRIGYSNIIASLFFTERLTREREGEKKEERVPLNECLIDYSEGTLIG